MTHLPKTVTNRSSHLDGRFVVVGVCGGVAAYKAVELVRQLRTQGAHVEVIMTESAQRFVGRATFDALASARVHTSLWDDDRVSPHTWLGQQADAIVVAPATTRLLASYASGLADDLLVTTLMATRAPVVVAPAMHTEMWEHAATQSNVVTLRERGVTIVQPGVGALAGGDHGVGRLADVDEIVDAIVSSLRAQDMAGQSVLITAGGTHEPIDPVRFIGNRSSGKQGLALVRTALARGADVTLLASVDVPSDIAKSQRCKVISFETAAQLDELVNAQVVAKTFDVVVMAAAVADYTVAQPTTTKLKKSQDALSISLQPTVDILASLGSRRAAGELKIGVLVGFAAETNDAIANAQAKLVAKKLDVIVVNDVTVDGAGFGSNTNAVTIVEPGGRLKTLDLAQKSVISDRIWDVTIARLAQ